MVLLNTRGYLHAGDCVDYYYVDRHHDLRHCDHWHVQFGPYGLVVMPTSQGYLDQLEVILSSYVNS